MVSAAGAGPNSSPDVMKNASEIDRYTGTPGTFSANDAVTTARTLSSAQAGGSGICGSRKSEWTTTAAPVPMTALTKPVSSRGRVAIGEPDIALASGGRRRGCGSHPRGSGRPA